MLLINVSLIMKCFIGELLLRKVTAFFPFPLPHLSGWSCMWGSSLLPSLLCSCWGFGQGYTFSDSAQFDFQFSVPHPLILWAKNSFWNRTPWHETCFFFSILYLPMLSTNSLPHCNSYKSAWGGICQHCCSGAVYLNSHSLSLELLLKTVSCFPRIEAVINETWQFIVYFSVTCCSFFSALMNSALSIFTSSEAVLKEIPYVRTSLKVLAMNTDVKVIYFSGLACLLS